MAQSSSIVVGADSEEAVSVPAAPVPEAKPVASANASVQSEDVLPSDLVVRDVTGNPAGLEDALDRKLAVPGD